MTLFTKVNGMKIVATLGGAIAGSNLGSAGTFSNVTTILEDVVEIFPPLVDMIIAIVPILIILALVGFIVGLFNGLLGGITGRLRGL